jgi:hypothetical protein
MSRRSNGAGTVFINQHHAEFARDVDAFLSAPRALTWADEFRA